MSRASLLAGVSGLLLPKHAVGEADPGRLVMVCDHPGCRRVPDRAPRMAIPSRTPNEPGHKAVRIMTDLHYCLPHHHGAFDPAVWLSDANKAMVEAQMAPRRPADFKPDFEAVRVEWLLVTTPEYHEFLRKRGIQRAFTA